MPRSTTPPSVEGYYWWWSETLPIVREEAILVWVIDAEDDGVWVAMECGGCGAIQYVVDMPGTWEGPLQPREGELE